MLPELPDQKKARFMSDFGLSAYDAEVLTDSRPFAEYFEETVKLFPDAKTVSNWMMGDFTKMLNSAGIDITESKVKPADLAKMFELISNGTISGKMAKGVFEEMFQTGKSPDEIVKSKGMSQITDEVELYPMVDQVLSENADVVQKIGAGDMKSFGFLVGQVMKYTQGRANPELVNRLLRDRLANAAK